MREKEPESEQLCGLEMFVLISGGICDKLETIWNEDAKPALHHSHHWLEPHSPELNAVYNF